MVGSVEDGGVEEVVDGEGLSQEGSPSMEEVSRGVGGVGGEDAHTEVVEGREEELSAAIEGRREALPEPDLQVEEP